MTVFNKQAHSFFKSLRIIFTLSLVIASFSAVSKPKTKVTYGYSPEGYAQVQIQNESAKQLACWVAINGFKKKFRLSPATTSQWIKASDKSFDYTSFSTWCDDIEFYPRYKNYAHG